MAAEERIHTFEEAISPGQWEPFKYPGKNRLQEQSDFPSSNGKPEQFSAHCGATLASLDQS